LLKVNSITGGRGTKMNSLKGKEKWIKLRRVAELRNEESLDSVGLCALPEQQNRYPLLLCNSLSMQMTLFFLDCRRRKGSLQAAV
jgi:hypothetical protein